MNNTINMTDRERILTLLFTKYYPETIFTDGDTHEKFNERVKNFQIGDMVLARTSGIHEWTIGYIENFYSESEMDIRALDSDKICRISNEMFYKIPVCIEGNPDFLTGSKYKLWLKVNKAFNQVDPYPIKIKAIYVDSDICTLQTRPSFMNDLAYEVKFNWNNKIPLYKIREYIQEADDKYDGIRHRM